MPSVESVMSENTKNTPVINFSGKVSPDCDLHNENSMHFQQWPRTWQIKHYIHTTHQLSPTLDSVSIQSHSAELHDTESPLQVLELILMILRIIILSLF